MCDYRVLANETLQGSRIETHGPAIINRAGEELLVKSVAALRDIEDAISELVSSGSKPQTGSKEIFGLKYLFGAYVVGSVRSERSESFRFLENLPTQWLLEALGSIAAFFQKTKDGYNCGSPPNAELELFLARVTNHSDAEISNLAQEVLSFFEKQRLCSS